MTNATWTRRCFIEASASLGVAGLAPTMVLAAQDADMTPVVAATVGASLGEGPVWDDRHACLWFVDINGPALYRMDAAKGDVLRYPAPHKIGWALPARSGKLLCGLQDGLHWFDPQTGRFTFWKAVEPDEPGNRLNDAATDAAGRVFFGSMDLGGSRASGRFYRLSRGYISPVGPAPVAITNGPAVSPDGKRIYFVDTTGRTIFVAALDSRGNVGTAQIFVRFAGDEGYPDGPVCDAAGNLWIGMYAGWGARCFAPDGRLLHFVRFPVANVTKLAFGGRKRDRLYATTAAQQLDAVARAAQPLAGDLFTFVPPIGGFRGSLVKA